MGLCENYQLGKTELYTPNLDIETSIDIETISTFTTFFKAQLEYNKQHSLQTTTPSPSS